MNNRKNNSRPSEICINFIGLIKAFYAKNYKDENVESIEPIQEDISAWRTQKKRKDKTGKTSYLTLNCTEHKL